MNALATHHAQLAAAGANDWLDGLDRFFVEQEIAYEQGLHLLGKKRSLPGVWSLPSPTANSSAALAA